MTGALFGAACHGGSPQGQKQSPQRDAVESAIPSATPEVPVSPAPALRPATGVAIVDAVITSVLDRRVANLEQLIDYHGVPCSNDQQRIGAPPVCPVGAQEGTPVGAIGFSNCEGGFIPQAEFEAHLADTVAMIDGVFSASRRAGGYVVVFTFSNWSDGTPVSGPAVGTAWMLSDRGLTATVSGCGASALGLAAQYRDFLIVPPPPPPPPADLRRTGQPGLDLTIEAVSTRNLLSLLNRVVYVQVPCRSGPYPASPYCPAGVAVGTPVSAFPINNCGTGWWYPPGEMAANLDGAFRFAPRVYAVGREPADPRVYRLVVQDIRDPQQRAPAHALGLDEDGRLVSIDFGCDAKAEDLIVGVSEFLLPPLGP
jgi:hypothetical protein